MPKPTRQIDHARRRERALADAGFAPVAGVDEAGIGPLAGPVVAAAVILPAGFDAVGLDDSKKLSAEAREALEPRIQAEALAWAVAEASIAEIDALNVYHAGLLAMRRAVEALQIAPAHLLVDGRLLADAPWPQTRVVGGDAEEPCIAAASVLAKVHRDRQMVALDRAHPGYGLARHKGYPTPEHQQALRRLGPSPCHRGSFRAVREFAGGYGARFEAMRAELAGIGTAAEVAAFRARVRRSPDLTTDERERLLELCARRAPRLPGV